LAKADSSRGNYLTGLTIHRDTLLRLKTYGARG